MFAPNTRRLNHASILMEVALYQRLGMFIYAQICTENHHYFARWNEY
jgi:hypothetical protein